MLKNDTMAIVAAIVFAALIIGGSILHLRSGLTDFAEVPALRSELAKTEAMLDSALRRLHHERLLHFGTLDTNAEPKVVSRDIETEEKSHR